MVFDVVEKGGQEVEERLGRGRLGDGRRGSVGTILDNTSLLSLNVLFQRARREKARDRGTRRKRGWCGRRGSLEREGKGNVPVFFTFVKEKFLFLPLDLSQVIASFTRKA